MTTTTGEYAINFAPLPSQNPYTHPDFVAILNEGNARIDAGVWRSVDNANRVGWQLDPEQFPVSGDVIRSRIEVSGIGSGFDGILVGVLDSDGNGYRVQVHPWGLSRHRLDAWMPFNDTGAEAVVAISSGDQVEIEYDKSTGTVRAYHNGSPVSGLNLTDATYSGNTLAPAFGQIPGDLAQGGIISFAADGVVVPPSSPDPSVRSVGAVGESSSGPLTLSEPAGAQAGDILLALVAMRGSASLSPPAGWYEIAQANEGNTSTTASNSVASIAAFWTRRGASAPALTFGRTGGDVARGVILAIQDARDSGSPLDGPPSINTLAMNSTTVTTNALTPANDRSLLVFAVAGADNTTVSGYAAALDPTSGWVEQHDSNTTTGADTTLAVATALKAISGPTGVIQAVAGVSSRHAALAFAIGAAGTESPAGDVDIVNVSDASITNGQAGVTIVGSGFSATGNVVVVSPTDNIEDAGAVEQTITSESSNSITFTAVRGSLAFDTTLYLFVQNGDGVSNKVGLPIQFEPRVFVRDQIVDLEDNPVGLLEDHLVLVWRDRPTAANPNPAHVIGDASTDANGMLEFEIPRDGLSVGDPVTVALITPDGGHPAPMGILHIVPDYE